MLRLRCDLPWLRAAFRWRGLGADDLRCRVGFDIGGCRLHHGAVMTGILLVIVLFVVVDLIADLRE